MKRALFNLVLGPAAAALGLCTIIAMMLGIDWFVWRVLGPAIVEAVSP